MNPLDRQFYVRQVLTLYLSWPDTPARFSRYDRKLAQLWFDQNITLQAISQAMLLTRVRRASRPPDELPLPPIRSLHYYSPVIHEILNQPLPKNYFDYLLRSLKRLDPKFNTDDYRRICPDFSVLE